MTNNAMSVAAIAFAALWIIAGGVALRRHRKAAVILVALCALPVVLLSVVPLSQAILHREAYVLQYGQAALSDLPLTAAVFGLSLLALVAAALSWRGRTALLVLGWAALAPISVLMLYLAFWFRIF